MFKKCHPINQNMLTDFVGASVGEALGEAEGDTDGASVGEALGEAEGDTDGTSVGDALGKPEGYSEGLAEGLLDGEDVGPSVVSESLMGCPLGVVDPFGHQYPSSQRQTRPAPQAVYSPFSSVNLKLSTGFPFFEVLPGGQ